jgi:hypothetical protein
MGRQLMYYWTILQKNESELVRAVFNAQRDFPTEGCWISEVQGVLKSCEIEYTEEQIKKMSKFKFKRIIKEKIQLKVISYLVTLQNKHTKSENLHLDSKMQEYLTSNELSLSQKKLLFKLRSKMLKIRSNFSAFHGNFTTCSLCEDPSYEETETHLLNCSYLKTDKSLEKDMAEVEFKDVYGTISEQKKAVKVFSKIMTIYDRKQKKN